MYKNIGRKIKTLAILLAYICVVGGIMVAIVGIFLCADDKELGLQMLIYGLVAGIAGFLSSWPLYGFGELIEKVSFIADTKKRYYF